jgi:hypothetical protein
VEKCDEAIAIINDAALRCKAHANVYLHEPEPHLMCGVWMVLWHFFFGC